MAYLGSEKLKQIVTISGIALLGGILLFSLSGFIPAFLGAVIFYVIFSPLVHFLTNRTKMKKGLAVSIILILSFLIIVIPLFSLTYILTTKVAHMFSGGHNFYLQVQELNQYFKNNFDIDLLTPKNVASLQTYITNTIPNLVGETLSILADIGIMYFILYYLLLYTDRNLEDSIERYLPYKKENASLFAKELVSQTNSNVIGAPLLALVQGIAASIGFWIFGLQEPIFWGIMCGFLSFIPFVGSALIWVPAGLVQLSIGAYWQGFAILIYGSVVIINIDNLFRMIFQKKIANVHPLTTVFGVIIGFNWFGIPGFIFGPLLISYLLIMIKLYRIEYGDKNLIISEPPIIDKGGHM